MTERVANRVKQAKGSNEAQGWSPWGDRQARGKAGAS
jgi:hypothetical protein